MSEFVPYQLFPLSTPGIDAVPKTSIQLSPVDRPVGVGDVLYTPGEMKMYFVTKLNPSGGADIEVFDSSETETRSFRESGLQTLGENGLSHFSLGLAHGSVVDDADTLHALVIGYGIPPAGGSPCFFGWWGTAPLGAQLVSADSSVVVAGSLDLLEEKLLATLGHTSEPQLSDTAVSDLIEDQMQTARATASSRLSDEDRQAIEIESGIPGWHVSDPVTIPIVSNTSEGVALPHGEGVLAPADRYLHCESQEAIEYLFERSTDAVETNSSTAMVLDQTSAHTVLDVDPETESVILYDSTSGDTIQTPASNLTDICDPETRLTVHLRCLSRRTWVRIVGSNSPMVYSAHIYRYGVVDNADRSTARPRLDQPLCSTTHSSGGTQTGYLLSFGNFETDSPHLEYPPALHCQWYETEQEVLSALKSADSMPEPLSDWVEEHDDVHQMSTKMAREVLRTNKWRSRSA